MSAVEKIDVREIFYKKLLANNKKNNTFIFTEKKIGSLISEVKTAKEKKKKENRDYWLLKNYDVLTVQNIENLIVPVTDRQPDVKYFCAFENLFDILLDCHKSLGHSGRDRMKKELNLRYKNITYDQIQLFLNLCEQCQQKRKGIKKGIVVKPIISPCFNSRCQIDLIDYQSQPDGEYKFTLVYQDHLTKFVVLRPLKSKTAHEVSIHVLDIFLLLGAPCILQSDNGKEFSNEIINSLKVGVLANITRICKNQFPWKIVLNSKCGQNCTSCTASRGTARAKAAWKGQTRTSKI